MDPASTRQRLGWGSKWRHSQASRQFRTFGVTGYSFTQGVENIRSKALAYDPDILIYAYCLNDPQEYSLELEHLLAEKTKSRDDYARVISEGAKFWLEHSRLFLLTRYIIGTALTQKRHPVWHEDDPQFVALSQDDHSGYFSALHESESSWAPVASALDDISALARSRQMPAHMVIFPLLKDLDAYALQHVHQKLHRAFVERQFQVLDLHGLYNLYEAEIGQNIGKDALHPTAAGHAFTAVAILHHLLETNNLPGLTGADFLDLVDGSESAYAGLVLRGSANDTRPQTTSQSATE